MDRLPAGHGTFTLASPPAGRVAGAAALAELCARPELLARWLRAERSQGASLWDDGAGLEAQLAFLAGGEQQILGGFGWLGGAAPVPRAGQPSLRTGGTGGAGGASAWSQPDFLLAAVARHLAPAARRRRSPKKGSGSRSMRWSCRSWSTSCWRRPA